MVEISQAELRAASLRARASLPASVRRAASAAVCTRLDDLGSVQQAQKIACYLPLKTEVDTWPFVSRALAQNKFVFVPVVQKNYSMVFRKISADSEFRTSELGISEPLTAEEIDARELDVVVMPLVAFDSARNRIGMGGGYYDRVFEFAGKDDNTSIPSLIGVAFDCQCVEKISPNPWDIKLSKIITESRAY